MCDPNEFMIEEGKKSTYKDKIEWVVAPAEDLPFKENTFDAYSYPLVLEIFLILKNH